MSEPGTKSGSRSLSKKRIHFVHGRSTLETLFHRAPCFFSTASHNITTMICPSDHCGRRLRSAVPMTSMNRLTSALIDASVFSKPKAVFKNRARHGTAYRVWRGSMPRYYRGLARLDF